MHCIAEARKVKPECPLCRAALPASHRFVINHELRDLIKLASALSTVQAHEDWQQVVATPVSSPDPPADTLAVRLKSQALFQTAMPCACRHQVQVLWLSWGRGCIHGQ